MNPRFNSDRRNPLERLGLNYTEGYHDIYSWTSVAWWMARGAHRKEYDSAPWLQWQLTRAEQPGQTWHFLFLSNRRDVGSSPGMVFGGGKLWSRVRGGKSSFPTIGDDDRVFQGMAHNTVGQSGCGAAHRLPVSGRWSSWGVTTMWQRKRANLEFGVLVLTKNWSATVPFIAISPLLLVLDADSRSTCFSFWSEVDPTED
jgi:hypothetical protein